MRARIAGLVGLLSGFWLLAGTPCFSDPPSSPPANVPVAEQEIERLHQAAEAAYTRMDYAQAETLSQKAIKAAIALEETHPSSQVLSVRRLDAEWKAAEKQRDYVKAETLLLRLIEQARLPPPMLFTEPTICFSPASIW